MTDNREIVFWFALLLLPLACEVQEDSHLDDALVAEIDTLELVFSIGEELGDSTNTFWSVIDADIDDHGRIFVLDEIDASVKVYSVNGEFIQYLTRYGAGPGELIWPRGLAVMRNGDILITASMKKGFVIFNDSLEFVEEVALWENNSPYHVSPLTETSMVLCRYDENPTTNALRHTAAIYNWGETVPEVLLWKDSIIASMAEIDRNPAVSLRFVLIHLLNTCGDDEGNVYLGVVDSLEYRVVGWDSTGSEFLNITRDMSPVLKTPEELDAETIYLTAALERLTGVREDAIQPYNYRPMITDVGIGPDGLLWVRRGTRTDLFFDVLDLEGNLLRHVLYPLESWSWETTITPYGILAWELDPLEGYQKLYMLR